MTKMMTSIACLQLIEKGVLSADDPSLIEKHLPELWSQPIITGLTEDNVAITQPRTQPITLRHLLTHTAGLAYMFSSPLIAKWEVVTGAPSWLGKNASVASLAQPTLFEPGSKYTYGINIDWAGVLVMRVTGQTLDDYFQQHIFGPSGVAKEDLTFYPTDSIRERLMTTCGRAPDGSLVPTPGLRDVKALKPEDIGTHLGGAGLLGTPKAHMAVLHQILLAKDGKSPAISKSVYNGLFAPALPPRDGANTCHADLGRMLAAEGLLEPQYISGDKANHSLGLCLFEADSCDGPKAGSGFWGGAARTRYWIDPSSGIAVSTRRRSFSAGWC
jgi:CubicO group peptidase (beta-lactamase class C family)